MTPAYYNENHPPAVEWLRNNIAAGLIAPGDVDDRSIKDVHPDELKPYAQCHFFAGIGGWSYAARLAGWPDDRPLWTASCPCQPFSAAGKGLGTDDPRHLWPDLFRIVRARRPAAIVGEQVARKAGYGWLDGVCADLEAQNYASRAVDIPALAVDSPHERNRQYWLALADADGGGRDRRAQGEERGAVGRHGALAHRGGVGSQIPAPGRQPAIEGPLCDHASCGASDLADAVRHGNGAAPGCNDRPETAFERIDRDPSRPGLRMFEHHGRDTMADANQPVLEGQPSTRKLRVHEQDARNDYRRNGSWWAGADWIVCHDGKARRVADAGAPLLVNGVRGRIPVLRPHGLPETAFPGQEVREISRIAAWSGFGNAIVPPLAAEVIGALMDVLPGWEAIR